MISIRWEPERFWKWLALFAWRRWRTYQEPMSRTPDGIPGIRDIDRKCEHFDPAEPLPGDFRDCSGDGHYLCRQCSHYQDPDPDRK